MLKLQAWSSARENEQLMETHSQVIACANLGNGVVNGCKGKVEGFTMAVTTAAGRQRYFDQLDPRTDLPFGMTKDEAREKYPQVQEHLRWPIVSWTKEDGSPLEAAPVLPYSFSVQDITCGDVFATRLQLPLLAGYALTIHKVSLGVCHACIQPCGRVGRRADGWAGACACSCARACSSIQKGAAGLLMCLNHVVTSCNRRARDRLFRKLAWRFTGPSRTGRYIQH